MKKIIALVLAIMMIASMSVVVFAANESIPEAPAVNLDDSDNNDQSAATKIEYKPKLGYEVIIPGNLELVECSEETGDGTTYYGKGTGPVAINSAKIPAKSKLELTVTGANKIETEDAADNEENMKWKLIGTSEKALGLKIFYNITLDETKVLGQGDVVLSYTSGKAFKAQSGTLTFQTQKIIQAGDFEDTLTFAAKIVPAN